MNGAEKFSFEKRLKSFSYAFKGLSTLFKNEHNALIHLAAAIVAVAAGFIFEINATEWLALVIVSGLVFVAELFNSSVEALADSVTREHNDMIGRAKDYAAAAVLVAAIISVIAGLIIFVPKIITIFKH